jgi:hypothetical protein
LRSEAVIGKVEKYHLVTKGNLNEALKVNSMISTPFVNASIAALASSSAFQQSQHQGVVVVTGDIGSIVRQEHLDTGGITRRIEAAIRKNCRYKSFMFSGGHSLPVSEWRRLVIPFFHQNHWTAIDADLLRNTLILYDSLRDRTDMEFKKACFEVKISISRFFF